MKARLLNYLITLVFVGLAGWAAVSLYQRYIKTPWTRDSQVRANIVGIAPRVSGPIVQVAVHDNQQVKKGNLLFEIDPADFQAQLHLATGQVLNAEANFTQQRQNLDRQTDLYNRRVTAQQDFQNAQDNFAAAQAQLVSAKASLELAKLNLSYTKVCAPVDGYVTNMNTSEGTYVTAGNQLMALVDTSSFWVAAYFKETQLPHIELGQKAKLTSWVTLTNRLPGWFGVLVGVSMFRTARAVPALACYRPSVRLSIGFACPSVSRSASRWLAIRRSRCELVRPFTWR